MSRRLVGYGTKEAPTAEKVRHSHAKVGGGKETHEHEDAEPGHHHPGLMALPDGKAANPDPEPYHADADETVKCPSCGKMNATDAKFCDQCGKGLPGSHEAYHADADETVTCQSCGKKNDPDAQFCDQCGASMSGKALGEGSPSTGGALVAPEYTSKMKQCPDCGTIMERLPGDALKCPNCGHQESTRVKYFQADFEVKSVETRGDGTLVLEGYGNTWDEDRDGEVTARKAFDKDLENYLNTNPVLLLQHDRNRPIGLVTAARVDGKGLWVRAEVPKPEDGTESWHVKAYHDIKKRILRAFSMGGVFVRQKSANVIERVKLMELSVVTIPSNPTSLFQVAHVKGLNAWQVEGKDVDPLDAKKDMSLGGGIDRDKLDTGDFVFSDERAFPVPNPSYVKKAVNAWGRYKGKHSFDEFKSKLTALAKRKGADYEAQLPTAWHDGTSKGFEDWEEQMAVWYGKAIDLSDDYWVTEDGEPHVHVGAEGKAGNEGNPQALIDWFNDGADGQIDWGSDGDFDDCVALASEHMDEDSAQGFCNLRHQDATGGPPGSEKGVKTAPTAHAHGSLRSGRVISHAHQGGGKAHRHRGMTKAAYGDQSITVEPGKAAPDDTDAPEVDDNEALDELLAALVQALDEVSTRDDLSSDEKVDNVEQILSDFLDEAESRLTTSAPPDGEETTKYLAHLEAKVGPAVAFHADRISTALARLRGKEDSHMKCAKCGLEHDSAAACPTFGGGPATATAEKAGQIETKSAPGGAPGDVDLSNLTPEQKSLLGGLLEEKQQRSIAEEAERRATEQLAAEQKAAEAEATRRFEFEKAVNAALETKMAEFRSGRKYAFAGSGEPAASSPTIIGKGTKVETKNLGDWLNLLRMAKRGNPDAYRAVEEGQEKAVEEWGVKVMGAGAGGAGYLVPPQYWQQGIAEYRIAAAKVRPLCEVIQGINTNLLYIPRETGISSVGWVADNTPKPSTDQSFGQLAVNIFVLAGISKVSNALLDDSTPAVDRIVRADLGRTLGQAEDIAFLAGTGSGQPTGILNTAGVLTGAIGTAKLADAIATAIAAIQSNYFGDPTAIVMHPRTLGVLRTAKDTNGRYIFEPSFFAGATPNMGGAQAFLAQQLLGGGYSDYPAASAAPAGTVWGLPVVSDANMPTNLGAGSNESPVIVGNFKECYVFERQGVTIDVSNEAGTSWESNQTWFRGEERLGFTAARQPTALYVVTGLTPGLGS